MSNGADSLKKKTLTLASYVTQLTESTDKRFQQMHATLEAVTEALEAVIATVGEDVVKRTLQERREDRRLKEMEQQKSHIAKLEADKILVRADAVTGNDGFIVGTERFFDQDKNVVGERRVQLEMAAVNPDVRPTYFGKKVGDEIVGKDSTLVIDEVFVVDRKRFEEVMSQAAAPKVAEPPVAAPVEDATEAVLPSPEPAKE